MGLYIKYIAALLLMLSCGSAYGKLKGKERIDSLQSELPKQNEDTSKIMLLAALANDYWSVNPDEGINYGQQALTLATKLDWKKGLAIANSTLGTIYCYGKSDYPTALEYCSKSLNIYEELRLKTGIVKSQYTIATIYFQQGNYPKALEYCLKNIQLYEELNDKAGLLRVISQTSLIYFKQKAYAKALDYDFKALKMAEAAGDKIAIASISGNIGLVYGGQNNNIKSLEYYLKALALYEELGNKQGIAINTNHIANIYSAQHDYAKTLEYLQRSLKLSEELGLKQGIAENMCMIGIAYLDMINDTGFARHNNNKKDGGIPVGNAALLNGAIANLQRALAISKEAHILSLMNECYKHLAIAYKMNEDYKTALEYTNNYIAIKDSVFSEETDKKIMQIEYDHKLMLDSVRIGAMQKIAKEKLQKQKNYTYLGVTGILLLASFSFFIVKERGKSEKERKKSDELLLNILPSEVAKELKTNGTTAARHFENVTVLFTDFVNFTNAGERMSPQALIDELHTCFKAFDEIMERHHIEKIKTIGDAYLAVAGLPTADAKHAENIVRAAMEIVAFMQDRHTKLGEKTFQVRVGVNSGNVVAGIVGVKKFAYDIWGDTVNTAARMEQNSEPGKINISQTTYDLVKDQLPCTYRGEILAKGKGAMNMYYVS